MRIPKCQICKEEEALWAMQFIASEEPSFTTLGSHYRGFKVYKVCDVCKDAVRDPEAYLKALWS